MWLCFNNSFLSIVHKDCAPDELLVRARRQGDIEAVFPEATVKRTPGNDYLYRAVVKRDRAAEALAEQAQSIAYGNFKDSVRDRDLHRAYMAVWSAIGRLQPGGPYGGGG